MALPTEVHGRYVAIIDQILSQSDLTQVTEKRIRNGIQERVEYDITPQKAAIKELILQRFDIFNAKQNGQPEPVPSIEAADAVPVTNGVKRSASASASDENASKRRADDSDFSNVIDDAPPQKKKKKQQPKEESVDDDAAFAAKLQAEEDRAARPTRGAGARKAAPAKSRKQKKASKKQKSKVTASDDSDLEDGASPRKVNRNTGFHKPMNLSAAAADFFGTLQLSRPQVTSEIWKYIKLHDLQDPSDKRYILCDDKLRGLLKQDKVHMFQMTKIMNTHMYNPEE